ncbi:MAG: hypothetical protein J7502_00425 [Flavisolibacter sp.]|nr:hypothetical protein [Flavisolibacter sp.]
MMLLLTITNAVLQKQALLRLQWHCALHVTMPAIDPFDHAWQKNVLISIH